MSLTVAYGALLTGVIVWLVLVRKLSARSWETTGVAASTAHNDRWPPARVGLWAFLAVITSLFALFISAYYMRMGHGHGPVHDWRALSEPRVLWVNTALLILGSVAMQWARANVARGQLNRTRDGLLLGGLLTLAFLGGQLFAWREIHASEFFGMHDPAIAFFYLLTAVHAVHLLGGLFVWSRTLARLHRRTLEAVDVRMSIELCTVYWHYLLLVWLVLFALLLST